jgi:hypothetical protein
VPGALLAPDGAELIGEVGDAWLAFDARTLRPLGRVPVRAGRRVDAWIP